MPTETDETMPVRTSDDVVRVRQAVRARAVGAGFSLVDQTKIVTAASEIARNTVDYGGGGTARIEVLRNGQRRGVRLTFTDQGPGIADLTMALKDGYTTGSGLGLGLSGAKRLCNEFDVRSTPGQGTVVTLARWV
ncbi:MAG: anti-sigma regulatory factor [Acetobacteraceae bacterium]|jgi:serine/threonine-protein kinase RsbT